MPRPWRRKYSALFDNVLESGLSAGQLATVIRLQVILHRSWRTDPVRCATWSEGDAEKILTLNELREATGVESPRKARAKILSLSGCDPYRTGALEIMECANPGWSSARVDLGVGARSGAQTVRVLWRNFAEVLHPHGPPQRSPAGAARPYEGRRTKNEARGGELAPVGALLGELVERTETGTPPYGRRVAEGRESPRTLAPSPGWEIPAGTPRLSEMTDEEREDAKRGGAALRERLRRRSPSP